jgi:hypothetical protein
MILPHPHKCDYCPNTKGEANHWWMRSQKSEDFRLFRWNEALTKKKGYDHICSESCAVKALAKWMGASA